MSRLLFTVCVALAAACSEPPQFAALEPPETRSTPRIVEVFGEGRAVGNPKTIELVVVLANRASEPNEAYRLTRLAQGRLVKQLETAGVKPVDIQPRAYALDAVSLSPDQLVEGASHGYEMTLRIGVVLRDLDNLQRVLGIARTVGAEDVEDLAGLPTNPDQLVERAREAAVDDALARAQTYAQQLGMSVGMPQQVVETEAIAPGADSEDSFAATSRVRVSFALKSF